jgi:tetratricopeptide (TPR) repeat protein
VGEYVPTTEEEKAKVAEGLLPWKGRWIPKEKREKAIQQEVDAVKARVAQQAERREWRNRATVERKVFIFEHTLPDDMAAEYIELFETYYKVFMKEWGITPAPRSKKPIINIYHDEDYFHQVSGAPGGVIGYYAPLEKDLHFYFDREHRDLTIDVMFHEGNHMLTHFIDERVWYPAWINEGLAEYYGASEWDPETKTMKVGGIQSARLVVLWNDVEEREGKLHGLEDLIRLPRLDGLRYSWAWSFCHFLMSTRHKEAFRKYYLGLARDKKIRKKPYAFGMVAIEPDDQIEALKRYLKVKDLAELEKEWHEYLKTSLSLGRTDLDYAGAGWIMALYGEAPKARKFFRLAIEKGTRTGYVYGKYAELLLARGRNGAARENAVKALEVDPLHGRARHLLGRLAWADGDKEEGERLMQLAMEITPDDRELWLLTELTKSGKKLGQGGAEDGGGD